MFGTTDRTRQLIADIWDDDYSMFAAGDDAPSKSTVRAFAREFGVTFPKAYVAHATGRTGGLYIEVNDDVWPKPKAGDVGPFWSFLYGLLTFAFSDEAPDWLSIRRAAEEFRAVGHVAVPVLKVCGDADVYCCNAAGELVQYLHEEDRFEPAEHDFFGVLEFELKELADRKRRKQLGEG